MENILQRELPRYFFLNFSFLVCSPMYSCTWLARAPCWATYMHGYSSSCREISLGLHTVWMMQLAAVAALCVQYEAEFRPNMSIVVKALQPLLKAAAPAPETWVKQIRSPSTSQYHLTAKFAPYSLAHMNDLFFFLFESRYDGYTLFDELLSDGRLYLECEWSMPSSC